jgi:signal peptidase I
MEATLFWIGIGLGGYAFVLRQLFERERFLAKRAAVIALHLLFTSAVGGLFGFVVSASVDLQGPSPKWPMIGTIAGLLWGIAQTAYQSFRKEDAAGLLSEDLEWVETSFSAILLAAAIMYAVVQAFKIPSGSMEDTLHIGDHLFVNKFLYGVRVPFTDKRVLRLREVRRGEIIVFEAPSSAITSREERERNVRKDFIKRAVGLPGDQIEVRNKRLYVNGILQQEPYVIFRDRQVYPKENLSLAPRDYQRLWESGRFAQLRREDIGDNFGPIQVPPDSYFVMGDNRDGSFDSRFWGPLPNRLLKGKAWVVYWPPKRVKLLK